VPARAGAGKHQIMGVENLPSISRVAYGTHKARILEGLIF